MQTTIRLSATLALVLLAVVIGHRTSVSAVAAPLPGSFLSFSSEPGDYIGGGQSLSFTPDSATFNVSGSEDRREFHLQLFPTAGSFWFLDLAAPLGQQLQPGTYEGATRWPFQSPTQPGLSFSGDGRGCNTLTGRFVVLEAKYGPAGYIERFHATFEQHCEGGPAALRGEVQIINPPPPAPLTIAVTIDRRAAVNRNTGSATVRGTVTCSQPTPVHVFGTLRQRANRFTLITGTFSQSVLCGTTPTAWSAMVSSGNGTVPFGSGPAQVDVSANGFDQNYGRTVTTETSATVQLNP
jgi:hypothetical protein